MLHGNLNLLLAPHSEQLDAIGQAFSIRRRSGNAFIILPETAGDDRPLYALVSNIGPTIALVRSPTSRVSPLTIGISQPQFVAALILSLIHI